MEKKYLTTFSIVLSATAAAALVGWLTHDRSLSKHPEAETLPLAATRPVLERPVVAQPPSGAPIGEVASPPEPLDADPYRAMRERGVVSPPHDSSAYFDQVGVAERVDP